MISNNFGRKYQCWLGLSAWHSKSCPNKRYFGTAMHYKLRSCSVSQWQYSIIFWKDMASVQYPMTTGRVRYAASVQYPMTTGRVRYATHNELLYIPTEGNFWKLGNILYTEVSSRIWWPTAERLVALSTIVLQWG